VRRALLASAGLVVLVGLVAGTVIAAGDSRGAVHVRTGELSEGLGEPAAVAVLPDGGVLVADIAVDSVTLFSADGNLLWRVDEGLDHPAGLGLALDGVWVADSGHGRLVRLDAASGQREESIDLGPDLHPIDVCETTDGVLWVAASPEDRIVILERDGALKNVIEQVDGVGLEAPRGLVSDGRGGVFVTETLSGRVLHLDADGALIASVGGWGSGAGEFYKPKDVAVLPDGGLAVVDSHRKIVQVMEPDGSFRHLVSDDSGPMRFAFPIGIAANGNRLYVADAGAASVHELTLEDTASPIGHRIDPVRLAVDVSVRDEDPSFVCRQCHDGTRMLSVGNWDPASTNHPLRVEQGEDVPERFRLSEGGDMTCHTCHFVHEPRDPVGGTYGRGDVVDFGLVQPRVSASRFPGNDLCVECHELYLDTHTSHRRTSHPIGLEPPPGAWLDGLLAAGAHFEGDRLVCTTCHPPHGAHEDPLLIQAATDGQICTSCHEDHSAGRSRHAVDVVVNAVTRGRIEALGGQFADNGHLTCLSCHDPHQSNSATLLRTDGAGTDACGACHVEESRAIRAGGHGTEACESCHGMHTPPRGYGDGQRRAGVGPDMCLDCHADGSDDPQVSLVASHPMGDDVDADDLGDLPPFRDGIGCSTCHEAHGGTDFILRSEDGTAGLCLECHPDQGTVTGTDHDARVVAAGGVRETCVSCHAPHGSSAAYLVHDATQGMNPANGRCLVCHDGTTDATEVRYYTHPERLMLTLGGLPFRYDGPVPYFGPDGERTDDRQVGEITCMTCHDPHRWRHDADRKPGAVDGTEVNSFLRDPDEIVRFCEVCHGVDGRPQLRFFHEAEYRLEGEGEAR